MVIPLIYITQEECGNINSAYMREQIFQYLEKTPYVIVDARHITKITSSDVSFLIEILTSFQNTYLVVTNVDEKVIEQLKIQRFIEDETCKIFTSLDDAVKLVEKHANNKI